jgi:hypothetical protein
MVYQMPGQNREMAQALTKPGTPGKQAALAANMRRFGWQQAELDDFTQPAYGDR